jgi:hypothetical protein
LHQKVHEDFHFPVIVRIAYISDEWFSTGIRRYRVSRPPCGRAFVLQEQSGGRRSQDFVLPVVVRVADPNALYPGANDIVDLLLNPLSTRASGVPATGSEAVTMMWGPPGGSRSGNRLDWPQPDSDRHLTRRDEDPNNDAAAFDAKQARLRCSVIAQRQQDPDLVCPSSKILEREPAGDVGSGIGLLCAIQGESDLGVGDR